MYYIVLLHLPETVSIWQWHTAPGNGTFLELISRSNMLDGADVLVSHEQQNLDSRGIDVLLINLTLSPIV